MNLPYLQFYCRDWMGEQGLQRLGYAERGLWIELLCLMATGDEYGRLTNGGKPLSVAEIARMTRGDKQEVEHLLEHLLEQKVCSVDEQGVVFCRRMVKDAHIRTVRSKAGKAGYHAGHHTESESQNPDPRSQSLLERLPEQIYSDIEKDAGKYAPEVKRILECRPEFARLRVMDVVKIIQDAERAGCDWRKQLEIFLVDAANAVHVASPTGMLRSKLNYSPHKQERVFKTAQEQADDRAREACTL